MKYSFVTIPIFDKETRQFVGFYNDIVRFKTESGLLKQLRHNIYEIYRTKFVFLELAKSFGFVENVENMPIVRIRKNKLFTKDVKKNHDILFTSFMEESNLFGLITIFPAPLCPEAMKYGLYIKKRYGVYR